MTGEPPIESVLDSIVESTPGGAYRRRRDGDQPLLDAEDGVAELTGCNADKLASEGRSWLDFVALDDRDRLRKAVAEADPGEGIELIYRIRRPDGELRRVQDRMRVDSDDPTVLEGVLFDETERFGDRWLPATPPDEQPDTDDLAAECETAAEREPAADRAPPHAVTRVRRDAALLDALLDAIPVHLYVKDGDAVHLRVSEHLDRSEPYVGKIDPEIDEVTDKHARQAYEDDLRVIEAEEPVLDKEEFLPALDQWNLTSKVPWTDDGEVRGLVGVSREITERKRAEQELRRKTERLTEFADVVSTDIREPLNVAREHAELAKAAGDGSPDSGADPEAHIDDVADAIDRANDIIGDVLTLSRQDAGEIDTEPQRLNSIALAAWQDVDAPAATLDLPDDEPVLRANRSQSRRLLANLFENSVERGSSSPDSASPRRDAAERSSASPASTSSRQDAEERSSSSPGSHARQDAGGRDASSEPSLTDVREDAAENADPGVSIAVSVTEDGFVVADDGPGIPPEERDRVFDPSYAASEGGIGFGLTIVREIADAHGWSVSIGESEAGGARFEISGVERADADERQSDGGDGDPQRSAEPDA